jgi:heme oxygenase (mycobilin-producing)
MVSVIIERHCKPGKTADLEKYIYDLRMEAIPMRGFSSGQTLQSVNDPNFYLVISTWFSQELWDTWYNSAARHKMSRQINALLSSPEKVTVFNYLAFTGAAQPVPTQALRHTSR